MALYDISNYSQQLDLVLLGFILCHTTSNLRPKCSNRAFFTRLPPSLVPSVRRKKDEVVRMSTGCDVTFSVSRQCNSTLTEKDEVIRVPTGAAFSKASGREHSPTEQQKMTSELLFSQRTFAGARFAERSTGVTSHFRCSTLWQLRVIIIVQIKNQEARGGNKRDSDLHIEEGQFKRSVAVRGHIL